MKAVNNIGLTKRGVILLLGIAVALFLLTVNTGVTPGADPINTPVSNELGDTDGKAVDVFTLDTTAINTVSQINLVHEFHLIWENVLTEETEKFIENPVPSLSESLSRILFERIISPNAP